jgi:hypothetical protein
LKKNGVKPKNHKSRNYKDEINMKKGLFKLLIALSIAFLFESCTVHKYLSVYDGSKADGTITMFYEYGAFDKPIVHWEEAKRDATLKCKNWGYNGAEFFGTGVRECISVDGYGNCNRWRVIYKYQCTE